MSSDSYKASRSEPWWQCSCQEYQYSPSCWSEDGQGMLSSNTSINRSNSSALEYPTEWYDLKMHFSQYLTSPAEKTHASLEIPETLLHIPILALMHSTLCNDYQPLDFTTKWSSCHTIWYWLHARAHAQSQVLELGRWQDEYLTPNPNTNLCLLFRINYASNQGWVHWFRRIFMLGQRGPEQCGTRTGHECSMT
jgi:hypothetical protein